MAISEAQLETWSHQGSITGSSSTYNSVKDVLEETGTPYSAKNYSVFLQGSYGNDTNIYAESDVDIVICLNDCFQSDRSKLTVSE
jgi:tRNA nucleotidyltransferase (CCA-adding enzyme)